MMNARAALDQAWAYFSVNGATVAPADGSDAANGGFREGAALSSQRTGAGAYTCLLLAGQGLDADESYPEVTLNAAGATNEFARIQQTDDRTFLVTTFAAAAPADRSFKISIRKVGVRV
jgi:hypothetical protein